MCRSRGGVLTPSSTSLVMGYVVIKLRLTLKLVRIQPCFMLRWEFG